MSRRRNWCITVNNPDEIDYRKFDHENIIYAVYATETGKKNTKHIQAYIELNKAVRLSWLKELWPRGHFEARKGTAKQASEYCMKDGVYVEKGVLSSKRQGARTDLDGVREMALYEGMRAVTSSCNYQQIRVAESFLTYNEEPRDWEPEVIVYWGESGVGKSRRCREEEKDSDIYVKNDGTKWWDGYDGHEVVIIDDFRGSWWTITETLSLLDRYEKRVQFKGGWRQFKPKRIYITSNTHPDDWYMGVEYNAQEQMIRRLKTIEKL